LDSETFSGISFPKQIILWILRHLGKSNHESTEIIASLFSRLNKRGQFGDEIACLEGIKFDENVAALSLKCRFPQNYQENCNYENQWLED